MNEILDPLKKETE